MPVANTAMTPAFLPVLISITGQNHQEEPKYPPILGRLHLLSRETMKAGMRTNAISRTALQAEYPPEPNHTSL